MHSECYSILYSSATGNTRLLADTIRAALPPELCDAFGAAGETAAESELLYVGFWTDKGNADADTLALVDLVPVVFFGLSAVRAGSLLHSALFVAGAVVCLVSGVVKVLWKGITAVTRRNIWPMFVQMRVFMPAGFALIAAAGIGRRLLEYGAEHYGIREVTVNEQNPQAVGFYEHMGFVTYKRTDRDEQGGPYPLLYMRRA